MSDYRVCISVRKETHDRLKRIGNKGDSFDDIIQRLLNGQKVVR